MLLFLILPLLCPCDAVLPRGWFRAAGQVSLGLRQKTAGRSDDLDDWIQREEGVALERLLDNAAPGGRHVLDLAPGTIVASPSRDAPDYYYQCARAPFSEPANP
jgi:hypothetical protein